jgi:aminoglycoside phosphotransferase (APT) family kinase protein
VTGSPGAVHVADLGPRLRDWLSGTALSGTAPAGRRLVRATRLSGGYRNDNIALTTGTGERYVLRRYPLANACAVEAALAARLAGVVPVAEVVAADPDGTAAGEPVLLSRFVSGVAVGARWPTRVPTRGAPGPPDSGVPSVPRWRPPVRSPSTGPASSPVPS